MKLNYERPIISKINAGVPDKFGMTAKTEFISNIDGIPVATLLKDFGSPLYVVSEKKIKEVYKEAYTAFSTRYPKVQFAWSYKTNYLDAVCQVYHKEGSWAEVVSEFEFDKAISNGVPGNKIIFNGPDKDAGALKKAIENGSYIHLDNYDELYNLVKVTNELNKKAKVAIRINMDTGIYPQWDRFGFNYDNGDAWSAVNRIMMHENLDLVGLHCHIGTYIMSPQPYAVAASKLAALTVEIEKKFSKTIKYIDMGGGFASKNTLKGAYLPGSDTCPTFDQYAEAITDALINSEIKHEHLPTLFLETGRALIDEAGYLLGTVQANKRLADGRRATIIDIGINFLFTSFWYNHDIYPAEEPKGQTEDMTIYGPLCMNIDVIKEAVKFPALQNGEHVVIKRIGAYNMTQWLQFITLRPNVVLIDSDNNVHIIRNKETNEDIQGPEQTPDYLMPSKP